MAKKLVICLNLDTVKNKNLYQFNELRRFGFCFLACGYRCDLSTDESSSYQYFVYPKSLILRATFVWRLLMARRKDIHHVELYTGGGSFLGVEYLLAKVLGLKVCVVERGSPLRNLNQRYGTLGRAIRKAVYKRADVVWIRELWMKDALKKLRRDDYFFLSNAIRIPSAHSHSSTKPMDFLWCNSLISWRNSAWFVDALSEHELEHATATMLGFLEDNPEVSPQQEYAKSRVRAGVSLLPFLDPSRYFLVAKFFVLPADIVYLNFSLLEAMAHGVVPIVSNVEGAHEIVVHGESGFVADHSRHGLAEAMKWAARIDANEYERLSRNARRRVKEKFSIEQWGQQLHSFYMGMGHV